jgi:hypothetical protein
MTEWLGLRVGQIGREMTFRTPILGPDQSNVAPRECFGLFGPDLLAQCHIAFASDRA